MTANPLHLRCRLQTLPPLATRVPLIPRHRGVDANTTVCLVDDPHQIRNRHSPAGSQQGWRPIDEDTGDEGGFVEGTFKGEWRGGDVLYGERTRPWGGHYVLGLVHRSAKRRKPTDKLRRAIRCCLWHMNYHPDGGQMFWPLDNRPLHRPPSRCPGDNLTPDKVVAFLVRRNKRPLYPRRHSGTRGIFPVEDEAAVSRPSGPGPCPRLGADIGAEFGGVYMSCPLRADQVRDV